MSETKNFSVPMHLMRGIGILLVVYAHVLGSTLEMLPAESRAVWARNSFDLVYSFHMHLFFFVSGYFGRKLIHYEPGTYRAIALRQFRRLGVVYLFYTALAIVMKVGMSSIIARPIDWGRLPAEICLYPNENPMMSLWFIYTLLLVQMIFLTINAVAHPNHDNRITRTVFILCLFALNMCYRWVPREFAMNYFVNYGLYFYLGYIASRRTGVEQSLLRWRLPILTAAAFYAFYGHVYFDRFCDAQICRFIYACVGIVSIWTLSAHLAASGALLARFFRLLADYSYEIYLNSPFFQLPIMRVYDRVLGWSLTAGFPLFMTIALLCPIPLTIYVYRRRSWLCRMACGLPN